ncbi:hypothetical protein H0E87_001492 [Populus deltoides]|uniref:RING-type E3 ubiquitin transferase n=1 Tax=Populus deltoides TaxID=3696 RepID=A0A8T2ZRT3_POPDE|nr:hypothetical protein H0E87_001492 [Populus deltoides]
MTNDIRYKRHISSSPNCHCSSGDVETILHVLRDYKWAWEVWLKILNPCDTDGFFAMDLHYRNCCIFRETLEVAGHPLMAIWGLTKDIMGAGLHEKINTLISKKINICTFYQKGICSYGSRCRYEHVKPSRPESTASSSLTVPRQPLGSNSVSLALPARNVSNGVTTVPGVPPELSSRPFIAPTAPEWDLESAQHDFLEDGEVLEPRNVKPADRSICSFAAAGSCPRGDKCPHIHGDLCAYCGKHCLHPFRPEERDEHLKACEKKQKNLDLLKYSQEIECSVCLDRVLSKPTAAERKFGLLSECDHPFCISCIRNWRSSSPTSGMDVNTSLRACPICRKLSYFVIPSVIWSIDCKHFDFGNGNCPFGTSCFYKHAYRDGRLEEVVLRHLGADDGQTVIAKNIWLSDFLGSLQISVMWTDAYLCNICLLMVEVTVPLTISKYAGYLSMSRHALNFIVEGLQSPVPNHVVCEFRFDFNIQICSENAWNSPNLPGSNYIICVVIVLFTNHQQLYHSSFLSLDFLVKPELMGFHEILQLCSRVHSSEISFKQHVNMTEILGLFIPVMFPFILSIVAPTFGVLFW